MSGASKSAGGPGRPAPGSTKTVGTNEMMRRRNLRVTEQLLAELEAKRYDSALVERILAAPSAFPHLLRACFLAQDKKYASARTDVERALHYGRDNPVVAFVAGMVLHGTRDYDRALATLEHATTLSPNAAHRARQQIIDLAGGLGWDQDVRRALEAAIAAEPRDAGWHARAARFFVRGRHWDKALEHARRAVEISPRAAGMWMEVAGLHAHLDQREQALVALTRALAALPAQRELGYRLEAARVAIDASDFDQAEQHLRRAIELAPKDPGRRVALAELHSWAGELDAASAELDAAFELDGEHGPAWRLRGGLAVLAGEHERAIELLRRAIELDADDYQAHVWLTEAYLRTGQHEQAHAQLHHGTMNAGGFLFVAWLLRFSIVASDEEHRASHDQHGAEPVPRWRTEEFEDALLELCPALAQQALQTRALDDFVAAVEAALTALRGNRSIYATHVVDGVLTRVHARTGCRHESRRILQLLRVGTAPECLALFDALTASYPDSSLPVCHRGELRLWLGDFAGGEADLRRAIELVKGTRWAYIGLSTLGLLQGDYEQTLRVNAEGVRVMHDSEGPAIYVYRGEAKRRLGRLDEAIAELEQAVRWHPARASATINLALAYEARGDVEQFEALWRRLRDEQASGLLSDAARELDEVIYGDDDWDAQTSVRVAVLERALKMMGGNRSSGLISYWTREGRLRFVQPWPHVGEGAHGRDHALLDQAKRMLLKALATYKGPRTA